MKLSILDPVRFKKENLDNWVKNTDRWLGSALGHVPIIRPTLGRFLRRQIGAGAKTVRVIDVGCGSAWALEEVESCAPDHEYVGIDFNPALVSALKAKHVANCRARFVCHDIEQEVPLPLENTADVVLNIFNFIEVAELGTAFRHCVRMLATDGVLVVCHVNPISQFVSMAESLTELREALDTCSRRGWLLAYDKYVDLRDGRGDYTYKGVAYPYSMLTALAQDNGLVNQAYEELLWVRDGRPQLYELGMFQRVQLP